MICFVFVESPGARALIGVHTIVIGKLPFDNDVGMQIVSVDRSTGSRVVIYVVMAIRISKVLKFILMVW